MKMQALWNIGSPRSINSAVFLLIPWFKGVAEFLVSPAADTQSQENSGTYNEQNLV